MTEEYLSGIIKKRKQISKGGNIMEKEFVKVTITFNEEQKQKFSNYIKREFKLKDDLKDDEISLYLKALILKLTGEVNFEEELEEIEQRIKNNKEIGEEFVLFLHFFRLL